MMWSASMSDPKQGQPRDADSNALKGLELEGFVAMAIANVVNQNQKKRRRKRPRTP